MIEKRKKNIHMDKKKSRKPRLKYKTIRERAESLIYRTVQFN